jgi:hypothetical protein
MFKDSKMDQVEIRSRTESIRSLENTTVNSVSILEKIKSKKIVKKVTKQVIVELNDYLTELEKKDFYSLLGLVNSQNIKTDREFYIYSVELLIDSRFKAGKACLKHLNINNQIKSQLGSVTSLEDLQKVLDVYNNSIVNKFVITQETFEGLIDACLK